MYDSQTNLVRFGARDYDAKVGRWPAKDPIGFYSNSVNLYCYVLNNPINMIDINGLDELSFNGSWLMLKDDNGHVIDAWPATSGKEGTTYRDQNIENYGPILEGNYHIDPNQIDRYHWYDPRDWDWSGPDARRAWGNIRIPIQNDPCNKTTRGGFFIHGGDDPGSIGCIDLTNNEADFFQN